MTTIAELLLADEGGFVKALPSPGIGKAVLQRVRAALHIDVRDLLMEAWRTRSALLQAARETLDTPGLVQRVTLKTFAMPWEHGMDLDVRVNGKHIATVIVGARVELEVAALIAIVQNGRLTAIEGGTYKVTVAGTVQSHSLMSRSKTLDLRYELPLGDGVPLLRA